MKGKGKWCQRLFVPDEKFDPPAWKFDFYPDQEGYNILMKLKEPGEGMQGLLNKIKKDEDGYYTQIKRPTYINSRKGRINLAPPIIVDADGNPWDGKPIGNGSDLTVKLDKRIYKVPVGNKMGIAIRLVSVRVDNLVPFEKKDFPDDMAKQVEGIAEQAKPNW
jgi:hypothetical protein